MTTNAIEMSYCHWVMRVAMSDMRLAEKLVTIVAPLLQTGDVKTLAMATRLAEDTVKSAKRRPAQDGWLRIHGSVPLDEEGRPIGGRTVSNRYCPGLPDTSLPVVVTDMDEVVVAATLSILHTHSTEEGIVKGVPSDTLIDRNGVATATLSTQNRVAPAPLSGQNPHAPYKESPTEITNTTTSQPTTTVEVSEDSLSENSSKLRKKPSYSEEFDRFWSKYPVKTNNSKFEAFEQWLKLDADDRALAVRALGAYAAFLKANPDHSVLHANRFIKYRRFEGFAEGAEAKPLWWQDPAKVAKVTDEQWRGSISKQANGHWPEDKLSPPPGTPGCKVPQRIIAELRLTERYGPDGLERPTWKARKDADA